MKGFDPILLQRVLSGALRKLFLRLLTPPNRGIDDPERLLYLSFRAVLHIFTPPISLSLSYQQRFNNGAANLAKCKPDSTNRGREMPFSAVDAFPYKRYN
ncbi:hypothetical protein KL86CLO1_13222 [uncultured Eubacteriales bacterium]|uniref:Uncharacterized protein n=1 Tax=uncultured Eubacteriales bacterium TaxID=172733 RepID=A0A212KI03_9FIRM|nr:hypothetical protein KL86CLO1_13222 [uncultured Eubacteriales bacterium]